MRYIKKGKEPRLLTEYKTQQGAYYEGIPSKTKEAIREQLLQEQGYLCAYCMRRIGKEHMKIEHWIPQHDGRDPNSLDYSNMLGVGEGNAGHPARETTCDTHRGDQPIKVNPLQADCIREISYDTSDGRIYSLNETIDHDLNFALNLNCNEPGVFLCSNRKEVLEEVLGKLLRERHTGNWSQSLLEKMLQYYEKTDKNGRRREYSGIAIWYLKKKLNRGW